MEDLAELIALVDRLVFGADPAQALEPFARAVAAYDAQPDPAELDGLLTTFGYVVLQFDEYSGLPLNRTLEILDDLEQRHREVGNSPRIVHFCRWLVARQLGDAVTAEEQYQACLAAPRDEFSWCEGCEQIYQIRHLIETERAAEAVAVAEQAFATPVDGCHQQPQALLAAALPGYVAVGDLDAAADAHRTAYRLVREDPDELFAHAQHIRFCVLTGNQERAEELVRRHRGGLDADVSEYDALAFCTAAGRVLGEGEFTERAWRLVASFDRRNGNDFQGELVRTSLAERLWVEELELFGDGGCAEQLAAVRARPDDTFAAWDLVQAQIEMAHRMHLDERNVEAAEIGEQALTSLGDERIAELAQPESLRVLRNVLFAAYLDLNEPTAALPQAEKVLADIPPDAGPDWLGMILRKKGELLEQLNRDGEARDSLIAAATQYGLAGLLHDQIATLRLAAQSARYIGELDQAETLLGQARSVVDQLPADDLRSSTSDAVVHWELALVRDMQGRLPEAIELAEVSAALYESVGQLESASNARDYAENRQARLNS
ncbi:tetratricopeptide repeat protein [Kribbella sp. CA-293567]|uniref:tetratricopeptide repeat protein n=1 Tax=Kribbella sp. CA-293567 TaxID=3002436 RepID=UPI0022DD571B|nr:tetratricopeptide repeat protein [Kribbella sp. CA-293567]WBQ06510.1 tetratricopeptide repeat protein [Kribbella sp. CA-293567]